jgi:hypothetical protein
MLNAKYLPISSWVLTGWILGENIGKITVDRVQIGAIIGI